MEIIKTLVYKGFGHLSTPETSEEFKKNLGIKNVLVYGSLIKKFAHHGLAGPYSIKFSFDGNIDYRIDKTFLRIKRNQYLFLMMVNNMSVTQNPPLNQEMTRKQL
ncbi:MAG: hypothetical protein WKF59_03235 [Chitinophagaceae bacterium]